MFVDDSLIKKEIENDGYTDQMSSVINTYYYRKKFEFPDFLKKLVMIYQLFWMRCVSLIYKSIITTV